MIDWNVDGSLMCGSETTETNIGEDIRLNEEAKPERDYLLDSPGKKEDQKKKDKEALKNMFHNFIDTL